MQVVQTINNQSYYVNHILRKLQEKKRKIRQLKNEFNQAQRVSQRQRELQDNNIANLIRQNQTLRNQINQLNQRNKVTITNLNTQNIRLNNRISQLNQSISNDFLRKQNQTLKNKVGQLDLQLKKKYELANSVTRQNQTLNNQKFQLNKCISKQMNMKVINHETQTYEIFELDSSRIISAKKKFENTRIAILESELTTVNQNFKKKLEKQLLENMNQRKKSINQMQLLEQQFNEQVDLCEKLNQHILKQRKEKQLAQEQFKKAKNLVINAKDLISLYHQFLQI